MKRIYWWAAVSMVIAALAVLGGAVMAQDSGPGVVVFASDRTGNFEVFSLDPQTGMLAQLSNDPASDIEPVFSPDGEFVAFVADRDGDYELFVMRADGSDVRQLTANNAEDRLPRWQPDGEHLVYSSNVNGQWDLYAISADGAIVRQLTNDSSDERGPGWGEGAAVSGPAGQTTLPLATIMPAVTVTPAVPQGTVNGYSLNVRANPGEGGQIMTQLARGTMVSIVGRYFDNTWLQVRLADGRVGWVFAELLDITGDVANVPVVNASYIAPPPTAVPVTLTPVPAAVLITFTADRTTIVKGECATLSWNTDGIDSVYYNNEGVVGWGSRSECPQTTTTYTLRVVMRDKVTTDTRYITLTVNP